MAPLPAGELAWALFSVKGGAGRGSRPARGQRAGPRDAAATLPAYCSPGLPAAASFSAPAFPETAAAPLPLRVPPRGGRELGLGGWGVVRECLPALAAVEEGVGDVWVGEPWPLWGSLAALLSPVPGLCNRPSGCACDSCSPCLERG